MEQGSGGREIALAMLGLLARRTVAGFGTYGRPAGDASVIALRLGVHRL